MPETKGTTARKGGLNVDTALVRELADILAAKWRQDNGAKT